MTNLGVKFMVIILIIVLTFVLVMFVINYPKAPERSHTGNKFISLLSGETVTETEKFTDAVIDEDNTKKRTMNAKEKAKQLVDTFALKFPMISEDGLVKQQAKQCALIAVDEIIEMLTFDLGHDATAQGLLSEYNEVKSEIEKLYLSN